MSSKKHAMIVSDFQKMATIQISLLHLVICSSFYDGDFKNSFIPRIHRNLVWYNLLLVRSETSIYFLHEAKWPWALGKIPLHLHPFHTINWICHIKKKWKTNPLSISHIKTISHLFHLRRLNAEILAKNNLSV